MNNWKRTFGVIWTGQLFSLLSSSIVNFAIILWISLQTGSAEMLALAAAAGLLPQCLLSPFTGVYIDRWDRKKTMILADGFVALTTLLLAALFLFGVAQMWHIFLILALRSVGTTFHQPAMQASVPMLAPEEQMTRVAGITQAVSAVGNIAGPALGALLISLWRMEAIMMLDVAGAVLAIGSLLMVKIPNPERSAEQKQAVLAEIKEGVKEVLKNRGLSWAFLFTFLACMVYVPLSTLFPLLTLQHFGGTEMQVGTVQIVWSVGFLVGGMILGLKAYKMNRIVVINLMYAVMGAMFLVMGLLPAEAFTTYLVAAFVGGAAGAVYVSVFTAVIQTGVSPSALGRVFSMYYTLSIVPTLISLVVAGIIADTIGVATSFVTFGIIMILIGGLAFVPSSSIRLGREGQAK